MVRVLQYNATLVDRVDVTGTLSRFYVRPDRPPAERPWFLPGQYCVLGLNNVARPELGSVLRPMSIASAPERDEPVEFYVRLITRPVSENPLTALLWRLAPGGRLYMRTAAAGVFTIRHTIGASDARMRVMVAAGTGLAPFLSMLRSEVSRAPRADLSRWAVLHGASYPADLAYRRELLDLSASNRLKYWATVSRPTQPAYWDGDVGRVESFFNAERLPDLEHRLGLGPGAFGPASTVVFVCGLTGTIAGTIASLLDRGFVPAGTRIRDALGIPSDAHPSLFYEDYDTSSPVFDVHDRETMDALRARVRAARA